MKTECEHSYVCEKCDHILGTPGYRERKVNKPISGVHMSTTREIKFRAWDKKKGVMFIPYIINPGLKSVMFRNRNYRYPLQCELMQFTGLHDCNGVEIYEGDIVKDEFGNIGVVKWRVSGFEQEMTNTTGWWVIQEQGVVIGNVHQNPELIKEDK